MPHNNRYTYCLGVQRLLLKQFTYQACSLLDACPAMVLLLLLSYIQAGCFHRSGEMLKACCRDQCVTRNQPTCSLLPAHVDGGPCSQQGVPRHTALTRCHTLEAALKLGTYTCKCSLKCSVLMIYHCGLHQNSQTKMACSTASAAHRSQTILAVACIKS